MDSSLEKAIELQRSGRISEAANVLLRAFEEGHKEPNSMYFLGALLNAIGKTAEAIQYFELAVTGDPTKADFWFSYGNALNKLGSSDKAIDAYNQCISLNEDHVQALVNRALIFQKVDRLEDALSDCEQALKKQPTEIKIWLAYLATLGYLRNFDKASQAIEEAYGVFGDQVDLLLMHGNLLIASGHGKKGFEKYELAYKLDQNHVKLLNSIGSYLSENKNGFLAFEYHQRALKLEPGSAEASHGLGTAFLKVGSPTDAIPHFLEAIEKKHWNSDSYNALALASQYVEGLDEREIYDVHLRWAEEYASSLYPDTEPTLSDEVRSEKRKIRLAFVSADLRDHSVGRFMTSLIRHANNSGLEVFFYSDVKHQDDFTKNLEKLGGSWVYSFSLPDHQLYERIQDDQIDVLVDLAGHTGHNRLMLFARKPAPIQISWLGYPNTTGLPTMDYRFSDLIADPEGIADELSTEKIIRLRDGFHCFEPPVNLPEIEMAPCLQNGYLTFGSFNNQSKINGLTVEYWVQLLKELPTSRLILKNYQLKHSEVLEHWSRVFESHGIDLSRIEFVGYVSELMEHYQTYHRIDIGIDTFPYNGTTTTCEAMWMGVPVLTIAGTNQRSRTGASLLTHAGFNDFVADDHHCWIQKALFWDSNKDRLNELRLSMRKKLEVSPVGNGDAFADKFYSKVKELVLKSSH